MTVQWKGIVENQELHLATSLTKTLGKKVSRCCGSSFAHLYGEVFGKELILKFWCMTSHLTTD